MLPLDSREGGGIACALHSLPRAAACAKTLRLAFLFVSYCVRTSSTSSSFVLELNQIKHDKTRTRTSQHIRVSIVGGGGAVVVAYVVLAPAFNQGLNDLHSR